MDHGVSRFVVSAVLVAGIVACGEGRLSPSDRSSGPKTATPGDDPLVAAPGGMIHRSCMHIVPNGSTIIAGTNTVVPPNGASYQVPACAYAPSTTATGSGSPAPIAQALYPNGYTQEEMATYSLPSPRTFTYLFEAWNVPDAPTSGYTTSQAYFAYPSLQFNDQWRLEPTLEWGNGDQFYKITVYYCEEGIQCFGTKPDQRSQVGDLINGTIQKTCTTTCTWLVQTYDVSLGLFAQFTISLQAGDPNNYQTAHAGTIETYNLQTCNQYPIDGIKFYNLQYHNDIGQQVTPTWTKITNSQVTPSCQWSVDTAHAGVTLYHNVQTAISGSATPNTGTPATYTATGLGASPHTFQWYRNDSLMTGQTSSTFTWTPTDPVNYKLGLVTVNLRSKVQDSVTRTVTGNFAISIGGPTNIHEPVQNGECSWGAEVGGGYGTKTYVWKWDGTQVSTTSVFDSTFTVTVPETDQLFLSVTDSRNNVRQLTQPIHFVSSGGTVCPQ